MKRKKTLSVKTASGRIKVTIETDTPNENLTQYESGVMMNTIIEGIIPVIAKSRYVNALTHEIKVK